MGCGDMKESIHPRSNRKISSSTTGNRCAPEIIMNSSPAPCHAALIWRRRLDKWRVQKKKVWLVPDDKRSRAGG